MHPSTKKHAIFWMACFFVFSPCRAASTQRPTPKLLAIVVVDQMTPDLFTLYSGKYKAGLKMLHEKSAFFQEARFHHVPTLTASGHAVIITGQPPGKTGMIGNSWYDRESDEKINSVFDPVYGTGPYHLLVPTLGDAMKQANPASKVVSVSFKERSAVTMGGHEADIAVWFSLKSREFETSSYYGEFPSWLREFNERLKPKIPWWPKFAWELRSPRLDDHLLDLTKEALRQYRLGEDDSCDLLAVSFSATDNIGHRFGPHSPQMNAQALNLDRVLGELIATIENEVGPDYALVLTSDHGILPMPEEPDGKKMEAKRISKRKMEKSLESALAEAYPGGPWIAEMSIPDIYFNKHLVEKNRINWEEFLIASARQIKSVEGVAAVYLPPDFNENDDYRDIYQRSYLKGRSGDIMLRWDYGLLVTNSPLETNHGSPYDYDSVVPLVFFGKQFVINSFSQSVSIEDVAPTCAYMLGLDFPASDFGRVLKEIFQPNK